MVYAILEYQGERIETDFTISDCSFARGYPLVSTETGGTHNSVVKLAHFRPIDPDATAGEVFPPDALHPANARLVWTWKESDYKKPASAFSATFPEGVM